MNVHPAYFGKGIARRLLSEITNLADDQQKPTRLVSSAMNLDSFSLYTRAGFVPRMAFQDMLMQIPQEGLSTSGVPNVDRVRNAKITDLDAMVALEEELSHIRRPNDLEHFLTNTAGYWHVSVIESASGNGLDGYLASIKHPASTMIGPGVMRAEDDTLALLHAELNHHRGGMPVWLVPVEAERLVRELYRWGAKNCEIHFAQVKGTWTEPTGMVMPTFMPETG